MFNHVLCVGGTFNDQGGRPSGYFSKLVHTLVPLFDTKLTILNGGSWNELCSISVLAKDYDLIIWSADVPNDKPKLLAELKVINPEAMLVVTKNNRDGKYDRKMLTARALKVKANLLLEFNRNEEGNIFTTIIDPLGNSFLSNEYNINTVATILYGRLMFLNSMTRVKSEQIGDIPHVESSPEIDQFFELVRGYANQFHTLIHADDNGRMLGNLSFRCESGFPTIRQDEVLLVSRRNVDKRDVGMSAMVPVAMTDGPVLYLGENKPSVDTPIQRELYKKYPHAKFMLHAHVYIDGGQMTKTVVPCGALQEVDEVLKVLPEYDPEAPAYVNLRGHGSIAIASTVDQLVGIPYIARSLYS